MQLVAQQCAVVIRVALLAVIVVIVAQLLVAVTK
jgi:hypothetical protein